MSERKEIQIGDNLQEVIMKMSEGNLGATNVLMQILKEHEKTPELAFGLYLFLDDMNIRGTQIWIGYKEYCESDIKKFIQCVNEHDEKMIAEINKWGEKGNHEWLAVKAGASVVGRKLLKEVKDA